MVMSSIGSDKLRMATGQVSADLPFSFEHFEQRRQAQRLRRSGAQRAAFATVAALAVVLGVALVTQPPPRDVGATRLATVSQGSLAVGDIDEMQTMPALVNLDQFERTSELEDQIALLDAQLSAASFAAQSRVSVRELESTRAQLQDSLQRVSYAHSLMSY
jgi:hypothetical protein